MNGKKLPCCCVSPAPPRFCIFTSTLLSCGGGKVHFMCGDTGAFSYSQALLRRTTNSPEQLLREHHNFYPQRQRWLTTDVGLDVQTVLHKPSADHHSPHQCLTHPINATGAQASRGLQTTVQAYTCHHISMRTGTALPMITDTPRTKCFDCTVPMTRTTTSCPSFM